MEVSVVRINKKQKEKKMLMGWWGSQCKIQYSFVLGVRVMLLHHLCYVLPRNSTALCWVSG